jgi:hypothetical protein
LSRKLSGVDAARRYLFSAKGAAFNSSPPSEGLAVASPGHRPREYPHRKTGALKARFNKDARSIPHVAFVEFDAAFAQKVAILLLKTTGAMVLFLIPHVFENGIKLTGAY